MAGGWGELERKNPAMMTLIALAISIAYPYSAVVVVIGDENQLFCELAKLVVIMLLSS